MITSIAILVLSTAIFFFYIQTLCEKVLRREFSHPYFQDVLNAIDLEFPRVRQALADKVPMNYSQVRLALRCDFATLSYLVKKGDPKRPHFSWQERLLVAYFRVLILCLPLRYALHFGETQSVVKLTVILNHFANLAGERVRLISANSMASSQQY